MMLRTHCQSVLMLFVISASSRGFLLADEPRKVHTSLDLEVHKKPIEYFAENSQDRIAQLSRKLQDQEVKLEFTDQFGYLPALLKKLDIPISSQLLLHASMGIHGSFGGLTGERIGPHRPRAIYFDDDVVVTSFANADQLEIAAQDSQKGIRFYSMRNRPDLPATFELNGIGGKLCLNCHRFAVWQHSGVEGPGHIVRSGLNMNEMRPYWLGSQTTHALPIEMRWIGRYVTGLELTQKHRGNSVWEKGALESRDVTDLAAEFETALYPSTTSDAVAHLVFDHLMVGQNLLARLSYEHQLHVRSKVDSMVIRYLLLVDEAPIDHPIHADSEYARWYQARGPKTADGRSLYELDLQTRLFRHRISPLVQSRVVQGFPAELRQWLFARLNDALTGKEPLKGYSIPDADRDATLAVLRGTIPDWPAK